MNRTSIWADYWSKYSYASTSQLFAMLRGCCCCCWWWRARVTSSLIGVY